MSFPDIKEIQKSEIGGTGMGNINFALDSYNQNIEDIDEEYRGGIKQINKHLNISK